MARPQPDCELLLDYTGFLTLTCRIESLSGGRYRATTEGDGRGPQTTEFRRPFVAGEEVEWLRQFQTPFSNPLTDRWRLVEQVGRLLFDLIFQQESLVTWRLLHRQAQTENRLLRLVLDIATPDLQPLPWETFYDSQENFFLARDLNVCIVRYPRDPDTPFLPPPRRPLRILALAAAPKGLPILDVAGERERLETALQPLVKEGEVEFTWLDGQTEPLTLNRVTRFVEQAASGGRAFDILHYVGHAGWSQKRSEGVLYLEGDNRGKAETSNVQLGELLRTGGLRLAVLNACEGSREETAAPFRSVAATLLRRSDITAVIANQIPISDDAAKTFAASFYQTLAARKTVEEGVSAARREVGQSRSGNPEWVATIFYSRYPDREIRLLPDVVESHPYITAAILCALTILMGMTVVSLVRLQGWLVGGTFQVGVWLLAAWFALDRRDQILRYRYHVLGALGIATLIVFYWFVGFQPVLNVPTPKADFALSLESPSPFVFQDDQLATTNLSIDVTGVVQNLPADAALWMIVQEEGQATYTVGGKATIQSDGRFLADDVLIGPAAPRTLGNVRYTIQPVLVDAAGDAFLQRQSEDIWRFYHPDFRAVPEPRLQDALVIRR